MSTIQEILNNIEVYVVSDDEFYGEMSEYELAIYLSERLDEDEHIDKVMAEIKEYFSQDNLDSDDNISFNGVVIQK